MENLGTIIIITIVLIILIWIVFKFISFYSTRATSSKNYTVLVKDKTAANVANTISGANIPTSSFSNEYSISFWIHVDDYKYRYGTEKVIMMRGADDSSINPKIILGDKSNSLIVKIALQTQDPNTAYSGILPTPTVLPTATPTPTVLPTATSTPTVLPTATTIASFSDVSTAKLLDGISTNDAPTSASLYNIEYFNAISGNSLAGDGYMDYGTALSVADQFMTVKDAKITSNLDVNESEMIAASPVTTVSSKESFGDTATVGICTVKELPLQKWVHIVVSVYNNIVDIYIDGKLASSCVLPGFPINSTADLKLVPEGGFAGSLANIVSVNGALNPSEVSKLYYAGPESSIGFLSTIASYASAANPF